MHPTFPMHKLHKLHLKHLHLARGCQQKTRGLHTHCLTQVLETCYKRAIALIFVSCLTRSLIVFYVFHSAPPNSGLSYIHCVEEGETVTILLDPWSIQSLGISKYRSGMLLCCHEHKISKTESLSFASFKGQSQF